MTQKRKVLIVGGGSAGWITAAYLNGALNNRGQNPVVDISLVESPDIPRISVGEATIPPIIQMLGVMGINELDFMKATDATFKQSIKFVNWAEKNNTSYHHPFTQLRPGPIDRAGIQWANSDRRMLFTDTVSVQPALCEQGLAPVMLGPWNMGRPLKYAFHMNAQKFADYLCDFSAARGVTHIRANMTEVNFRENGHITSIATECGQTLDADLFVDCTGFAAKLIGKEMNVGWEDFSPWLLCDRAMTMLIPYEKSYPGMVRPYTTATALSSGWIWDIGLGTRRAIGYVHASQFIDKDEAEQELRAYEGAAAADLPTRTIDFKVGRRHKFWEKNCLGIGLSGGFIEPLESTGLYLCDLAAVLLAEHFPYQDDHMEAMAFRCNRIMAARFHEILDFINMHYCLTRRTDTDFWREVQKPEHITDRLRAKLDFWRMKPPSRWDFDDGFFPGLSQDLQSADAVGADRRPFMDTGGLWQLPSHECILYGMNYLTEAHSPLYASSNRPAAVNPQLQQRMANMRQKLPPHDVWLQKALDMKSYERPAAPPGWVY